MSISAAAEPQYDWELITPKAARNGAGALSYQGKIWLLGGWNLNPAERSFFPRICNNEVWASGDGRDWMLVKPNTFKDRPFDSSDD